MFRPIPNSLKYTKNSNIKLPTPLQQPSFLPNKLKQEELDRIIQEEEITADHIVEKEENGWIMLEEKAIIEWIILEEQALDQRIQKEAINSEPKAVNVGVSHIKYEPEKYSEINFYDAHADYPRMQADVTDPIEILFTVEGVPTVLSMGESDSNSWLYNT